VSPANIIATPSKIKPAASPISADLTQKIERLIADRLAYPDGVEAFVREVFDITQLRELQRGCKPPHFIPCVTNNYCWGYRLIVPTPRRETLTHLDRQLFMRGGVLSRFDLAFDFIARNEKDAEELAHCFEHHCKLKWRRKMHMHQVESTIYWCRQKGRTRRTNRDLVLYRDRVSKITGQTDCVHLELRVQKAQAVKGAGINRIRELRNLDPSQLFNRYIQIVDWDQIKFKRRYVRKNIKGGINHKRINQVAELTGQYRVQRASDIQRKLMMTPITIGTPCFLEYPPLISHGNQKKGGGYVIGHKQQRQSASLGRREHG